VPRRRSAHPISHPFKSARQQRTNVSSLGDLIGLQLGEHIQEESAHQTRQTVDTGQKLGYFASHWRLLRALDNAATLSGSG
jgi:hypothetical protein